jgi:membrane-associated phospholipid phosphatase
VLVLLCFSFSKEQLFFAINLNSNFVFDYFFYGVTELGNTWTFVVVIVLSLFISKRFTFMLIAGLLISTLLAQGLKHGFFADHDRPLEYFKGIANIHHLSYSAYLKHYSFPSGHTVSAFTLVTVCIAFLMSRRYDLFLLFTAFLVGYSRIYLGQHFFEDVVFGSFIGVFSGTLVVLIFKDETRFQKPLLKVKSEK